ncbi:MAG TPA: ferritin-like domain-containing protein [Solirubrobacteraceae bacterium]|nr:ferritin-like domain-containing protein [Solirubrobacteraceae bacterium]
MIDTREELIDALNEAAELEHGLLVQYLFAAYSLKKRLDEGLTARAQEQVRGWEGVIAGVAREEMAHLGTVCNLLSAIGAAPRFGRPNFPQPSGSYYPFDFRLTALHDATLYRFVCFELPVGEPPPDPPVRADFARAAFALRAAEAPDVVPDPEVFRYVGELYGKIREGFRAVPEGELFIGPRFAQDTDTWSNSFRLHLATGRSSAERAIDAIVLEGEGSPANREGSHYDRFRDMRAALAAQPKLVPSRPVVDDPRTRAHRDAPLGGTLIEREETVAVAELANAVYITMLLLLLQYYGYGGETPAQRDAIRSALRQLMSAVFRPLAEILTELPVGADPESGTAGPPFELYYDVRPAPHVDNRFTILLERLDAMSRRALELAGEGGPQRLAMLADNMAWLRSNLARAAAEGP